MLKCAIYALRHLHLHLPRIKYKEILATFTFQLCCCLLESSYHLQSSMSDIKRSEVRIHPYTIYRNICTPFGRKTPILIDSLKPNRFKIPGIHGIHVVDPCCLGILTTPVPWKTAVPEALGMILIGEVVGTGILFASTLYKMSCIMQVLNWQAVQFA